jgi:hypothetical protein
MVEAPTIICLCAKDFEFVEVRHPCRVLCRNPSHSVPARSPLFLQQVSKKVEVVSKAFIVFSAAGMDL